MVHQRCLIFACCRQKWTILRGKAVKPCHQSKMRIVHWKLSKILEHFLPTTAQVVKPTHVSAGDLRQPANTKMRHITSVTTQCREVWIKSYNFQFQPKFAKNRPKMLAFYHSANHEQEHFIRIPSTFPQYDISCSHYMCLSWLSFKVRLPGEQLVLEMLVFKHF